MDIPWSPSPKCIFALTATHVGYAFGECMAFLGCAISVHTCLIIRHARLLIWSRGNGRIRWMNGIGCTETLAPFLCLSASSEDMSTSLRVALVSELTFLLNEVKIFQIIDQKGIRLGLWLMLSFIFTHKSVVVECQPSCWGMLLSITRKNLWSNITVGSISRKMLNCHCILWSQCAMSISGVQW